MVNRIFFSVIYLIFLNHSFGQSIDASTIIATDLNNRLDSIFADVGKNHPGCAVTIIEHGKVLTRKDYGMANIENQVPFTHQSVVKMPYSEAREFISIAAVLMDKKGVFNLNDKVRKYFPDLPDWSEPVTLWDLLNHRSGFVDEWSTLLLMYNSMSNRFETEQFLRLLYNQSTPEIEPGKGYMYCNSDFGLLRLIMEKASGENLPDWIEKQLFVPLQMMNTHMQKNPTDIIPNNATLYEGAIGGGYQHAHVQKTSPGGNYYILTTANDLEIWAATVNDISSEVSMAITKLTTNVRQMPGKENHFIIGYTHRSVNNQQVIIHEGVNGYKYMTHIPSRGLTIITLGNLTYDGFSEENEAITDYFLKKPAFVLLKLITKPILLPESELSKYTGNFRWQNQVSWEGSNQTRKFSSIFIEDGKLKMRINGNYVVELTPVAKDVFYYHEGTELEGYGAQFEFSQTSLDSPLKLVVTYDDGFPGVTMIKDTEDIWNPSIENLKEFTGRFYSKHLDYFWNIELNQTGKLILKSSNLPDIELEPDGYNQFHFIGEQYPGVGFDRWILYNKDDQGVITHLTVWTGRVMHHRFDKQ